MVGMMMLTFMFFFCFVVNIGMLVNAKINLQNAADLAAYAGAAVQARQLNTIAELNYEMRRAYKKFLFRYYVIGTMSYDSVPKTVASQGGSTPRQYAPNLSCTPSPGSQTCPDYGVPLVCMIFNADDNYCRIGTSPAIEAPLPSNFDAINQALTAALANIENLRENNCLSIGFTNKTVLSLWLWNTDPTLQTLITQLQAKGFDPSSIPVIQGLASGLGLVPRNLLLRQRISTVQGYVNNPSQSGVTFDQAMQLKAAKDPTKYERTIQAYLSAYLSLGDHTFSDPTAITMDELMPSGGGVGNLLALNNITTQFDTWAEDFTLNTPTVPSNIQAKDCVPTADLQQIQQGLVVGVQKDPTVLTYYAIRLQAQAKVLFNPFGGSIQLTAYSAARPFGSRLGPRLSTTDFTWNGAKPTICVDSTTDCTTGSQAAVLVPVHPLNMIPNLPIQVGEGTAVGKGWDSQQAQGTLFGTAFPSMVNPNPTSTGTPVISSDQLNQAYEIAMAPNPEEQGYYSILTGGVGVNSDDNFAPAFTALNTKTLWAPLAPPDQPGAFATDLANTLTTMIPDTDPSSSVGQANAAFKTAAVTQLVNYVTNQISSSGEDEKLNTVTIHNPFYSLPTASSPQTAPIPLPNWLMPDPVKNEYNILTSWFHPNDATYRSQETIKGRAGYSVKFVPLSTLTSNGTQTSELGQSMQNSITNEDITADLGVQMSH
jgi:hypothetical protein